MKNIKMNRLEFLKNSTCFFLGVLGLKRLNYFTKVPHRSTPTDKQLPKAKYYSVKNELAG